MTLMEPVKSADTIISLSSVSSSKEAAVLGFSASAMRKMKEGLGANTAAVTTALWTERNSRQNTETADKTLP